MTIEEKPHKVVNGIKVLLSDDEIRERAIDEYEYEKEQIAIRFKQKRIKEYGDIGDQLDEIFHNFDAWKARIAAIKESNPKP